MIVITISTAEELKSLQGQVLLFNYVLRANIDLGGIDWIPIANLLGEFDGNGFTISNFKLTTTSNDYVGIFGKSCGVIKNLGVENFIINVDNSSCVYFGGLVGYNDGTITNSYATGDVNLTSTSVIYGAYAGGLVGYSTISTISYFI